MSKLKKHGVEIGNRFVNHTRKVKKTCLGLMKVMKKRMGKDNPALTKARATLTHIAQEVAAVGQEIYAHLDTLIERPPIIWRLTQQLATWVEITEQVIEQTKRVMDGCRHIPGRIVSLFDTEARPIRRGKLRVDTEFGRKVLIGETDHGIITIYKVLKENPSDTTLLKPAVQEHKRLFRKRLKAVAADRGFYSRGNEEQLQEVRIKEEHDARQSWDRYLGWTGYIYS